MRPRRVAALFAAALAGSPLHAVPSAAGSEVVVPVERWVATYAGPATADDVMQGMVLSPDGSRVFATGASCLYGVCERVTVAFDTGSGGRAWVARNGTSRAPDHGQDLALSPDGDRLYVVGSTRRGVDADFLTIAYSAGSGRELWRRSHNRRGWDDYASRVAVGPAGDVIIAGGTSTSEAGGILREDVTLVAYDARTGAGRWVARYDGGFEDGLTDVAISPDGSRVYASSFSVGVDLAVSTAIAYDMRTGATRWIARNEGPGNFPADLEVAPDGSRVYLTGSGMDPAYPPGFAPDTFLTTAHDSATGARLWEARYSRSPVSNPPLPSLSFDRAYSMTVSPDGQTVYVAGESRGVRYSDSTTVAYDAATGAQRWVAHSQGLGGDAYATAVATSPDGARIYVAGTSDNAVATVAFDSVTGIQAWGARHGSFTEPARGALLALDGSGRGLYVGGILDRSSGGAAWDFLLVAYDEMSLLPSE